MEIVSAVYLSASCVSAWFSLAIFASACALIASWADFFACASASAAFAVSICACVEAGLPMIACCAVIVVFAVAMAVVAVVTLLCSAVLRLR